MWPGQGWTLTLALKIKLNLNLTLALALTLTREAADKAAQAVSPAMDAVKSVWEEVTGWLEGLDLEPGPVDLDT